MRSKRIIIFLLSATFLIYGLFDKEHKTVFTKAATICLECIGIG